MDLKTNVPVTHIGIFRNYLGIDKKHYYYATVKTASKHAFSKQLKPKHG
jgi:hypothetical protein